MERGFPKVLGGFRRLAAAVVLTVALVVVAGSVGMAQSKMSGADSGLAGVWLVEVTLRNCLNGDPLGPPFASLVTFHRGGTITESPGSLSFAPGQRSPGHGVWDFIGGRTYSQDMIALILFDTPPNFPGPGFDPSLPVSPGFFAGWQTIGQTVELSGADHFTSTGSNTFYKSDGTVYRTGCSTAVARRFE
jgi:hypothetical protein